MPSYNADSFAPPAPVARVTLRSSDQESTIANVPMILDTGADVSLVPRGAAEKLSLPDQPAGLFELVGFDGRSSTAPAFELEMSFAGRVFRGRFLLIEEEWGILGRNILNSLPLLFDGPRLTWELHTSPRT
jgi:hypothetical protein